MFKVPRIACLVAALVVSVFAVGCAGPAPNYAPSIDNVEAFKKSGGDTANVGAFTVAANLPGSKSISLRANTMVSPVGAHFGDYIATALRQELELAKLYNAQSGLEISGVLLRNNIDAGGISTNAGQIEARFVVKRGGQVRYNKVKRIEHQWESSFVGAVAIPLAANNYPVMVQKLIGTLVSDPDFVQSLRN
ncbi:MAG: hypothetical protein RIS34_1681 [Pseudomonadota bacterium]|jgi:hypothetical protein